MGTVSNGGDGGEATGFTLRDLLLRLNAPQQLSEEIDKAAAAQEAAIREKHRELVNSGVLRIKGQLLGTLSDLVTNAVRDLFDRITANPLSTLGPPEVCDERFDRTTDTLMNLAGRWWLTLVGSIPVFDPGGCDHTDDYGWAAAVVPRYKLKPLDGTVCITVHDWHPTERLQEYFRENEPRIKAELARNYADSLSVGDIAPAPEREVHEHPPNRVSKRRSERFPNRAAWLKDRLYERGVDPPDLHGYGGPNRETVLKILDGYWVQNTTLGKLGHSLSQIPVSGKRVEVRQTDIPKD